LTIGHEAGCVVGPRMTFGPRPAGEAAARGHPLGGAGPFETVNPACITGRLTDHGRGDLMADAAE